MKAEHQSSNRKDTTVPRQSGLSPFKASRRLMATAVIGSAVIGYLVHKTQGARQNLECLTATARSNGELTENDIVIITKLLAKSETTSARTHQDAF